MSGRTKNYLQYPARSGKLCVLYVRVSKGEKVQQSIPGQVAIGMKIAARLGYRLALDVGHEVRDHESGALIVTGGVFKDERPRGVRREGLHEMLDVLDQRPDIGAVIFWEFQRLWGHAEQYRRLNTRAVKAGYKLIDETGRDFVSRNPDDMFIQQVNSNVAERETATTGRRAKSQNTEKGTGGKIVTRPVLGLRAEPYLNDEGKRRNRILISEHDMNITRRIFTEYGDGKRAEHIIEDLVKDNVRTEKQIQKGQPSVWYLRRVLETLDNPIYIGIQRYNQRGTEWVLDDVTGDKIRHVRPRHPSEHLEFKTDLGVILAEDPRDPASVAKAMMLFNKVKERRDRNGRERPAKKHDGPLQYLVVCGRCGTRMQRTNTGYPVRATGERRETFSYICPRKGVAGGKRCRTAHSMAEKKLFKILLDDAERRASAGVSDAQTVTWRTTRPQSPAVRTLRLARELVVSKEATIDRINAANEAGSYDRNPARFGERLGIAEDELATAQAELERLEQLPAVDEGPVSTEASIEAVAGFIAFFELLQDDRLSVESRRREAHTVLDRIEIDHPHATVYLAEVP